MNIWTYFLGVKMISMMVHVCPCVTEGRTDVAVTHMGRASYKVVINHIYFHKVGSIALF